MPEFKPFGRQTIARDALARVRDHARRPVEPDDLRHLGARREGLHDVADARTDLHDGCGGLWKPGSITGAPHSPVVPSIFWVPLIEGPDWNYFKAEGARRRSRIRDTDAGKLGGRPGADAASSPSVFLLFCRGFESCRHS